MGKRQETRFGAVAVERGYISQKELIKAINVQLNEILEKGEHRLIGQIIRELGYMTDAQVNEVLTLMEERRAALSGP